jgi:HK97 family phage portal protein
MFERIKSLLWPPSVVPELRGIQTHTATDFGRDILINSPDGWEHDQQYMWWVDGPGSGTGYGNPPPDAQFSGAAALPAVLRCTSIICDTIAGLPWRVYRGYEQQPVPRWLDDPQLARSDARIFAGPTVFDALSAVEFRTQWILSALWFGDGFLYTDGLDINGQPRPPLAVLDPTQLKIDVADRYGIRDPMTGDVIGKSYWYNGTELDPARVIRLRGEPPYANGELGTGVLERFSDDLLLASAMRAYASNIFTNGIPSGYLKINAPREPTDTQVEELQDKWMRKHGGPRKRVAVLNSTTDFVPLSISPVDAGFDTAKTWSLRDIALAFGIPAYMLGVPGDPSTYANVESRMTELDKFSLLQWIRRIESTLDSWFPQGTEVKIISEGTLRADTSTRYSMYESALRSGWLTVDEVRALEDRPPLPEQVSTAPEDSMPTLQAPSDVTSVDLTSEQPSTL